MRHDVKQLISSHRLHFIVLALFVLALNGCAHTNNVPDKTLVPPAPTVKDIEHHKFTVGKGEDVVGRLAAVRLRKGDTLPDIARQFGVGNNAISAANPGVDVWAPKGDELVILPLSYVLPDAPRRGIVINLATMRLFQYKGDDKSLSVATYPVGVGAEDRPTPAGPTNIVRKAAKPTWHVPASIAERHRKKGDILPAQVPPGPDNPLGEYALYLGKSGYLIHGTNKPASVGLQATNGCMRLYPENIKTLFNETPVSTQVLIVNQPYLVGQRNGVTYLEAHTPPEDASDIELRKTYEKLRTIEKKTARKLNWQKIKEVHTEARGIPVPVSEMSQWRTEQTAKIIELEHPARLYGKPEIPAMKIDAWYILAGSTHNELDAQRLAAMINHQGPPVPARVMTKNDGGFRIVAGPFKDSTEANTVAKRLKFDLDIDGVLFDTFKK